MTVYCIYNKLKDFPNKIVVRRWFGEIPDDEPTAVVNTLEEARKVIPKGLIHFEPMPGDDPVIIETWL